MALIQTSVSTTEPVTVAEVKTHLRIPASTAGGSTDEDTMLSAFISVARKQCELITKRQIIPAQWQLITKGFPSGDTPITIPRPPLSSASSDISISFVEDSTAGTSTTVPSTAYEVDYVSNPARLRPINGNSWSDFSPRDQMNAVTVTYRSGSATTPEEIKLWIKMRVAAMYEFREPVAMTAQSFENLPRNYYDGLLDEYRVLDFGGLPE